MKHLFLLALAGLTISPRVLSQTESDTLDVIGKAVVVISPNRSEYEALLKDFIKADIDSILDEFYFQVSSISSHLEMNSLKPKYSASSVFKIVLDNKKVVFYERKRFPHMIGFILSDGASDPAVVSATTPPEEWLQRIVTFFKLE